MTSDEGLPETQPAGPSPTDPTRTCAPLVSPQALPARPSMVPQLRDHARYDILGEHGRGGLGRVSRAHDRELGRDIAIKELISRGDVGEVRFLREALITARLEHPGIVPVYEAGRWADGTPFYAMKLVAGRPLRDLILERETVDERIGLLHHVIAVADAIAYAHGRNIIHRDLKPSNVIVGDFGETVVIDWGLAKDLSADEESTIAGGPLRGSHDDGLTSTGSVLGTPAYMAPEQERGEPVDQRADVYAIGVMLWELCSLEKLPPSYTGRREHILRRSGIDQDLAMIIYKAVDPDPRRRYADAGTLATDLKAFKVGARIASRRYTPFAMVAHWVRRHRALTIATFAVTAIGLFGTIFYVRNIKIERDRADTSEKAERRARQSAAASLQELTLKHAELQLSSDPAATLKLLEGYRGDEPDRAARLHAEALGRGASIVANVSHSDSILWLQGDSDYSILALGNDGTITRTAPDSQTSVLARNVSAKSLFTYGSRRRILIYSCIPNDLCMLQRTQATASRFLSEIRDKDVWGMALSPSESHFAVIYDDHVLRIHSVEDPGHPREIAHFDTQDGGAVLFAGEDTIAVGSPRGVQLWNSSGTMRLLPIEQGTQWDVSAADHQLVVAKLGGEAVVFDTLSSRRSTMVLCHADELASVKILPGHDSIAYACKQGAVGTWSLRDGGLRRWTYLEGGAETLVVSADGEFVAASGGNGAMRVIDLATQLVSSCNGHTFRLSTISPPTAVYPFFLTGDVHGELRAWPKPSRIARVVANVHRRFRSAFFYDQDGIVASTFSPELSAYSPSLGLSALVPHVFDATSLAFSHDRKFFIAYGASKDIEVWSTATMSRIRLLDSQQGTVSQADFVAGTDQFLTSGSDGRILRWNSSGGSELVVRMNQPVAGFVQVTSLNSLVARTVDGALWRVTDTRTEELRPASAQLTHLISVPGSQVVIFSYLNGDIHAMNIESHVERVITRTKTAIRDIVVSHDGKALIVSRADGVLQIAMRHDTAWSNEDPAWLTVSARARHITLASNNWLIAACTDGTVWLYSLSDRTWHYLPIGTADVIRVASNEAGSVAAAFDTDGRIVFIDLERLRQEAKGINNDQLH